MPSNKPAEPWMSFLSEIDKFVKGDTVFHCLGGFVITQVYGGSRTTSDVDVLTLVQTVPGLYDFAGVGSPLHRRYKVCLDPVGIATLPENYEDRLNEIFPGNFERIRLLALDPYDLALAKLERNIERDRDDVKHLARTVPFDIEVLKKRYAEEFRVYVKNDAREDLTLQLWIDMIREST